jgi:DNA-directed RNA polymerase subunit M/transcription elongation factor TFIIS
VIINAYGTGFVMVEITDKVFLENFNKKQRENCAGCGSTKFILTQAYDFDISEAVFMTCQSCGHMRLELV